MLNPTRILSCILCLLLGACATNRPLPDSDFARQQQQLQALQSWQVNGKIGLRQQGRGTSAQVNWQQRGDHYALRLSGPLGIGTVLIDGSDSGVEVRNKDGVFQADNAEQLLLKLTGWQIPISDLRYWARGLVTPRLPVDQHELEQGRLARLSQGGWQIEYRDYRQFEGLWLPVKMFMSRPETQLTLLYKQWQLNTH